MEHSGPYLVNLSHLMILFGAKRPDLGQFGASKHKEWPWGHPKVQNWVSETHLVNIGQLDYHVVFGFGTNTGAI